MPHHPAGADLPIVPRVFAVLAAVLLVGSIALASILPSDISLRDTIGAMDAQAAAHFERAVTGTFGHGLWALMFAPWLLRPVWMIPVCLGIICAGGAVTAMTGQSPRRKQKRS